MKLDRRIYTLQTLAEGVFMVGVVLILVVLLWLFDLTTLLKLFVFAGVFLLLVVLFLTLRYQWRKKD